MKTNNAILSFFWNHFDFFIRFGYCRLGLVSKLMNKLLFWELYSSDFEKIDKKKQKENLACTKLSSEFKGKNKEDLKITFWGVLLQKSTDVIPNPQLIKTDSPYRRSQ